MKQSVSSHLGELRKRIILVMVFFLLFFILGTSISGLAVERIKADLIESLNQGLDISLVASSPFEYVVTRLRVGLFISLIFTLPVLLYHSIAFLKPALGEKERNVLGVAIFLIILLFVLGFLFTYLLFLRVGIWFLANITAGQGILNLWSINAFISFVFTACFAVGLLFLLPLLMLILGRVRIFSVVQYRRARKSFYVSIFILSALITPPDVVTQVFLALPLILLYELGIVLTKVFVKYEKDLAG